ncbi:MAG: hypothetical protein WC275_02770 [Bacilli bacterium]
MKKKLIPLLLLTVLASCTKPSPSIIPSSEDLGTTEVTSEVSKSEDIKTSEESVITEDPVTTGEDPITTSEDESTSEDVTTSEDESTSEDVVTYSNLSEISNLALTFKSLRNEKGVYKSSYYAAFTAQLLTLQDYLTTQSGYNNRYKAFVANETGHLTVNLNLTQYNALKDYKDKQQVYDFKGYIGLYNDEPEVDMEGLGNPVYKAGVTLSYDYKAFAEEGVSVNDLLTRVKATPFNSKGINWSAKIYKYHLKYLDKVENPIALFSDGANVIQMHSHDKINNALSIGNSYYIYAREGLFNFKPQLEYVGLESADDVIVDYAAMKNDLTATNLYAYKYELEKPSALNSNLAYADQLVKLFYFEGYANYYTKDGMGYVVLEDTVKEGPYSSYTTALGAKAMFVNNDHSVRLWDANDWENCPFDDYIDAVKGVKTKISLYFVGYVYNTMKYWQVQVLTNTITPLS